VRDREKIVELRGGGNTMSAELRLFVEISDGLAADHGGVGEHHRVDRDTVMLGAHEGAGKPLAGVLVPFRVYRCVEVYQRGGHRGWNKLGDI
jgi:hypothetical protein